MFLRKARLVHVGFLAMSIVLLACFGSASASAVGPPVWAITSVAEPTHLWLAKEGESSGELVVRATNIGDGSTDGSTITVRDSLPHGLVAESFSGTDTYHLGSGLNCALSRVVTCTISGELPLGDVLTIGIAVDVEPGAPATVLNEASVSGGGAEGASASGSVTISLAPAPFGVEPSGLMLGLSTRQAGAHADVTAQYALNTREPAEPVNTSKDVRFDVPQGLVGNAVGMPQCQMARVNGLRDECPSDTIVGMATVTLPGGTVSTPVFNIKPSPGEPVAFAFPVIIETVRLDTSVLSNGDYGVRVTAPDLSEGEAVRAASITIWGVPADHQGPGPIYAEFLEEEVRVGGPSVSSSRVPLLTNPTQCSDPLTASVSSDAWAQPGVFRSASGSFGSLDGCGSLPFVTSASILPDTLEAGEPAGYTFHLHVQQNNEPDRLAAPNVKNLVTTLPMGTVVSPSAAWGLAACSDAQFGLHSGRNRENVRVKHRSGR